MLLLIFLSISLLLILFFINMIINSIIIDMIINPFFPGEVWRGGAPPVRGGGSGGGSSPLGKQSKPHKKTNIFSCFPRGCRVCQQLRGDRRPGVMSALQQAWRCEQCAQVHMRLLGSDTKKTPPPTPTQQHHQHQQPHQHQQCTYAYVCLCL